MGLPRSFLDRQGRQVAERMVERESFVAFRAFVPDSLRF
jgi:hypothetical protein